MRVAPPHELRVQSQVIEIVRVGEGASLTRESSTVSRAVSLHSLFTDLSVGALYPVSRTTLGLIGLLVVAAGMVFVSLRVLRRPAFA